MTPEELANMSDEDLAAMSTPPVVDEPEADPTDPTPEGAPNVDDPTPAPDAAPNTDGGDPPLDVDGAPDGVPAEAEEKPPGDNKAPEGEPAPEGDATKPEGEEGDPKEDADKGEAKPEDEPAGVVSDYQKQIEELFQPFNANGKEMKIDNIADAKTLMQMGANYNKKMEALKPHLKTVKLLENNGLLDQDKLNYLIDLDKKNPEAIAKLVKDSGFDPLAERDEKAEYKPNSYTVDDVEVNLDSALSEISGTASYKQTVEIISNKWDDSSRKVLVDNPHLIGTINEHVSNGTYDQITSAVEHERMLGRLSGISDIDAYKKVGDMLFPQEAAPAKEPVVVPAKTTPPASKPSPEDAKRKAAASSARRAPAKKAAPSFDPLTISDEEIEKMSAPHLM